ncbi:MAG: hypothetical protein PHO15_08130 [Eubacteriales bacterium]|nr:hypothetical protein [Eubacteriales bacterium]
MKRVGLAELLRENPKASQYFDTLHPVVRQRLLQQANSIATIDDLYAFSNNAMTEALEQYDGIYQDGDTDPDG